MIKNTHMHSIFLKRYQETDYIAAEASPEFQEMELVCSVSF